MSNRSTALTELAAAGSMKRFEPGPDSKPAFLLTIDTEGDDVWSQPRQATTRNARFLPRFQALCERYGFLPTYLTNYEMANDPAFVEFGRDVRRRSAAEIGMHMHAWDTPPIEPLGARDWIEQPYAFEYPPALVEKKAETVTRLLERQFDFRPTSHRAGRFGFDANYARSLARLGYLVDCSVTPHLTWTNHLGALNGSGGPDFRAFPTTAYRVNEADISRSGEGGLIEVPMTIVRVPRPWPKEVARRLLGRRDPRTAWLRPEGRNLQQLLDIVELAKRDGRDYLQFTLHSSEFMPGGSPTFRTPESIETLYEHLERLFESLGGAFVGCTLSGFAEDFTRREGMRREAGSL